MGPKKGPNKEKQLNSNIVTLCGVMHLGSFIVLCPMQLNAHTKHLFGIQKLLTAVTEWNDDENGLPTMANEHTK